MSNDNILNVDVTDNVSTITTGVPKKTRVRVVSIYTPVNYRGIILPVITVEPKIKLGTYETSTLHIKSWSDISLFNIYVGGTIDYINNNGRCDLYKSENTPEAIRKADAVGNIQCPICGCKDIMSSRTIKRCKNPNCGYNTIKTIWMFLRTCLKIGNIPYMCVYNLWMDGKLKKIRDIWDLTKSDLNTIGLKGEDIDNFRCRLANTKEIKLEVLIHSLGINGIRAANAIDLARRINYRGVFVTIGDSILQDYYTSPKRKNASLEQSLLMDSKEPAVLWNDYIRKHSNILDGLADIVNITPPAARYPCAGFTFIVLDAGKHNRGDVMDLIRLNDGRVISSLDAPYWSFVTYLVTEDPNAKSEILDNARKYFVNIISLTELESKFNIKLPDNDMSFSVSYQPAEEGSDIFDI
jgi:hypothetical protein|nr:MAG TPA: DNA ligase [Caudoviricetes sp.]